MQGTLTDRQERFVHEYLIDQNAAAALRRCGYSTKTGGAQAHALMKNPLVRERIRAGLAALFAELDVTALRLLRERVRIAFFDPRKLFDEDNRPIPVAKLDDDSAGAVIVSYGGKTDKETIHVRTGNRNAALAALERRYAQFLTLQVQAFGELPEEFALPREHVAQEGGTHADPAAHATPRNAASPEAPQHAGAGSAAPVRAPAPAAPPRTLAASTAPPRAAPRPPAAAVATPARVCVPSRKYGNHAPNPPGHHAPNLPVRKDPPRPASLPTPLASALARVFARPAPRQAETVMD